MQNQFGQYGNMNPNYGMYPQMQSEMMQHYPMNYPQMPNMNMQNQQQEPEKFQEGDISTESLENLIVDALYEYCFNLIRTYYFSEENLNKDHYMRSIMNSDGYVEALAVTTFNKYFNS